MATNNPIQVLVQEHDIISAAEGVVQSLQNTWEKNVDEYRDKVQQLIVFFREYSDQFHHHKEEAVLFRKLKENPDFLPKEIISELEDHHQMFRDILSDIEEAVENQNWPRAQQLLESYLNDLLDHIAIENDELFLMAESVFSADELEHMFFLFEDIDRALGLERKRELAKLMEML